MVKQGVIIEAWCHFPEI